METIHQVKEQKGIALVQCKKNQPTLHAAVVGERSVKGKTSHETHYYVCKEKLALEKLMKATRRHWYIENSQHHVLDVTFREDNNRLYGGDSAVNIACFRRQGWRLIC